jgi:hypothetical protein
MNKISDWQTRDLISDSVNPVCGCSCASVFNVASKVAAGDEPHVTDVTHARVQPQTGSDSPKLKPGFASPKLKSSEIGRTSLSVCDRILDFQLSKPRDILFKACCSTSRECSQWRWQVRWGRAAEVHALLTKSCAHNLVTAHNMLCKNCL